MTHTKTVVLVTVLSLIIPWALDSAFSANLASLEVYETDGALPSDDGAISTTLDSTDSLELQLESSLATGDFYYNLYDDEIGGEAWFEYTQLQPDGTYQKKFGSFLTNIATYRLEDVSWVIQFGYDTGINQAFSYNNDDHTWYLHQGTPYEKWTRSYGVMGQYELLSMDRSVTEAPLFRQYYGTTAYLAETDEVTLISFGDMEPGETVERDVYFKANFIGGFGFRGYLLSTTHQPRTYYVDDDAPDDPVHGDPSSSDPLEDGSMAHPFDAIQEAIDVASNSDTVLVADGTYTGEGNHDIDFGGRRITVKSKNGPESTIIDCQALGRGFYFQSGEGRGSVVDGFTITNGRTDIFRYGAGMASRNNSSPTIKNCIIRDGIAQNGGGGIACGDAKVINCIITNNSAGWAGGGVWTDHSTLEIINCTIVDNEADDYANGLCHWQGGHTTVINSIFWNKGNSEILGKLSTISVTYSDVQGGWAGVGNINVAPLFVNAESDNFRLLPDSPCIDTGDPNYVAGPNETDLAGNPRVIGGRIDMGAYEANYIEVAMKFTPQSLNPGSQGKWVKAHFVLPEGFVIEDVDANTPATIVPFGIESDHINVFINEDGLVKIEAAFSRSDFCGLVTTDDTIEVMAMGLLTTGQYFYGTDTIRIISKKLEQLAVLSSYWLQTGCGQPDWCSEADLNQDSIVNFVDFALLDGCCIEIIEQ